MIKQWGENDDVLNDQARHGMKEMICVKDKF